MTAWREPVFGQEVGAVPAALRARLTNLASDIGTDLSRGVYYERMSVLVALAHLARREDPKSFDLQGPPTEEERQLGQLLGQAWHEGCSLEDTVAAANAPSEVLVAIGRRTIRRTGWLRRLGLPEG